MPKKINIDCAIKVYNSFKELSAIEQKLVLTAKKAAAKAYAPYSKFVVGAAVLMTDNKIIPGNNQENAAYPSGICAERVALFYASCQYPGVKIKAIAVFGGFEKKTIKKPLSPCGSCRQAMAEYEFKQKQPIRILMCSDSIIYVSESNANLLPLQFNL